MIQVIKSIFYLGPLIFGFGFLAPLSAQVISSAGWSLPFGMSALTAGFLIGGSLGLIAQLRGRWI